jgi:DnaJ-class molecular chaperone
MGRSKKQSPQFPNQFKDILKLAENLTGSLNEEERDYINSLDFGKIMEDITKSLASQHFSIPPPPPPPPSTEYTEIKEPTTLPESSHEDSPKLKNKKHKTCLPRTKDLQYDLEMTLEELYTGKLKKLNVKRKRSYIQNDGSYKIVEEKKKLLVEIKPGMRENESLMFKGEADELPGFETGDIVITIKEKEHPFYRRHEDNIVLVMNIGLYELFYLNVSIPHLNGSFINIRNKENEALFNNDFLRKIPGKGMPRQHNNGYGDLFINFKPIYPQLSVYPDKQSLISLFPPVIPINVENDTASEILFLLEEEDYEFIDELSGDISEHSETEDYDDEEESENDEEESDEGDTLEGIEEVDEEDVD